ncbi:nitronate monooxygenase [Marmoricola sp. OAE513]|uniref:NAD(P)H-dependent flavin oxidoreductase n=1 Tax=Marmoricola sp. OAE513 TaxID=2817894 RepID=UPI001DF15814
MSVLSDLGATVPVVAAPMAGGPSTPALVLAAAEAGGLGFLAGGYKTAAVLGEQIEAVRIAGVPFGVNLFVPRPVPVDPTSYDEYAARLAPVAAPLGVDLRTVALREDDDEWEAKIALLLAHPVPVVSFAFGIPDADVVAALRAVGTRTFQTVTSLPEGAQAEQAGVDGLIVQSAFAGGHSGTTTPETLPSEQPLESLLGVFRSRTDLPLWAAGGISTSVQVQGALAAGAEAVVVGTVLLRSPESGASATYKAALADPTRTETVVTRAFSGRPARALRNGFADRFTERAPAGYPAIHHLTTPLRRAAHEAGDPENINLWAGTGFADATDEPAAVILRRLGGV